MEHLLFSNPIKLNATRYGDREAISFNGLRFTYRDFNERINQLAHALQSIGVQKGDKVAFMLMNCHQLLEVIFACGKIGSVYVPINSRFVGPEIQHVLDDSEATLLIVDYRFIHEVTSFIGKYKTTKHFIAIGTTEHAHFLEYETWISTFKKEEPISASPLSESDTLSIMYTSGTTGYPKGAVRSHRSLYLVALLFSIEFHIGRLGKGLVAGPLYGAAALSISIPNLYVGNPIHILETFHPVKVLEAIEHEKTTTTFLAPPMLEAIFSLPENILHQFDVSALKSLISVGAPLHTSTKKKVFQYFKEIELNEFYGATELGGVANLFPEMQREKDRSVGVPMLGMEIELLNRDGKQVKVGETGAFFVKGVTLCDEYYRRPEANKESFRGEWLSLGDMGVQDEDGFYYIVDRKQDMILSGAINVYPAEIEGVLHEHPKVEDVAIIGIPDEKWGEVPLAVIVIRKDENVTREEIIKFCQGRLAKYKIPKYIDFVNELPRNLQGKLLKYQIRKKYVKE
ncbi:class I adenylate-forming enzyme family protein [Massilibacterium senegalense]|uniref:class I adenylate-forming enzyme family protein n=1 Tax=Massilibacterium senegalense TaxID=1632858 RepID=UPI00078402A6|nr:AMP-binding protein [Massilibacterium senegalense]